MSSLDELKAQAEALQSRQRVDEAAFERNALATDAACKLAFHYWLDLARQLNVLRPAVAARYAFDKKSRGREHACYFPMSSRPKRGTSEVEGSRRR